MTTTVEPTSEYRLRKGEEGPVLQRMYREITRRTVPATPLLGPKTEVSVEEIWEDVPEAEEG